MKKYHVDAVEIFPGRSFTSKDMKHPANWAECWSAEDFKRWGIAVSEEPDPEPPPPSRRMVEKWVVMERLSDQQLGQALSLMTARQKEKWRMPGYPAVYADDPEMLQLLGAIGADPKVVLA